MQFWTANKNEDNKNANRKSFTYIYLMKITDVTICSIFFDLPLEPTIEYQLLMIKAMRSIYLTMISELMQVKSRCYARINMRPLPHCCSVCCHSEYHKVAISLHSNYLCIQLPNLSQIMLGDYNNARYATEKNILPQKLTIAWKSDRRHCASSGISFPNS